MSVYPLTDQNCRIRENREAISQQTQFLVPFRRARHQASDCRIRGRHGNTVHNPSASLSDSTGTLILATTFCGSPRRQSPQKRKSAWRKYTSTVLRKRCRHNKRGEQIGKVRKNALNEHTRRLDGASPVLCQHTNPVNVARELGWRSDANSPLRARKPQG